MHKGHLLKFLSLFLFLIFSFLFISDTPTYATSKFINTPATLSNNLGRIPDGKDDLFYNNNIMFYEWCSSDGSGACSPPTGDQITWIGDSYSCGALGEIQSALSGVDLGNNPNQCSNANSNNGSYIQTSKFFKGGNADTLDGNPSGLTLLQDIISKSNLRPYLVFALGTNEYNTDTNTFASYIDELVNLAGEDTQIILTTVYVTSGTVTINDAIKSAADKYNNIIVADWAAVAQPSYYSQDGIHPTGHYNQWVQTIVDSLPASCGDIITSGDTAAEKIWSGFARLGYTDYQIAGLLGNIANEGGMSPARWQMGFESNWGTPLRTLGQDTGNIIGVGLVQFTYFKHLVNLADAMDAKAPDLMHFLEEDANTYGGLSGDDLINKLKEDFGASQGDLIANRLYSIQVQYISDTIQQDYTSSGVNYTYPDFNYSDFLTQTGDMCTYSDWWLEKYESPLHKNFAARCSAATDFYNQFYGQTFTTGSSSGISTLSSSSTTDSCGDGSNQCTNEGTKIAETAVSMAWSISDGHHSDPTNKQREVQNKIQGSGVDYTDCGKFVAAAVIESGADSDFPKGVTGTILSYLQSSNKWEEVKDWDGDESKLQDGDILVKDNNGSGHAMIYTGKTSASKGGTWTDASLGDHTGAVRNYEDTSYTSTFHAFRLKGDNNCNLSGGLTEDQAQKIADYYNSSTVSASGLPMGTKENCVSFSAWFVSYLTDVAPGTINPTKGDGLNVADNLISDYSLSGGDTPQIYSVFSNPSGVRVNGSSNHTGVIVGIESDGTVITIEAAWGGWPGKPDGLAYVWKYTMPSSGMKYAYLSDRIDSNKLNGIINR